MSTLKKQLAEIEKDIAHQCMFIDDQMDFLNDLEEEKIFLKKKINARRSKKIKR